MATRGANYYDRVAYMLEQYRTIRDAHLAVPLPTLAESNAAWPRVGVHGPHEGVHDHPMSTELKWTVAVLRRRGHAVTLHVDCQSNMCRIAVHAIGKASMGMPKGMAEKYVHFTDRYDVQFTLPGTAPLQLGRRGALWCIPRFLAWARRTRERAYAPDGVFAHRAAVHFAALADGM